MRDYDWKFEVIFNTLSGQPEESPREDMEADIVCLFACPFQRSADGIEDGFCVLLDLFEE